MQSHHLTKPYSIKSKYFSVESVLEGCLLFTIFFPYLPGLLPADTQPWYLFFFILLFFVKSISKNKKLGSLGFARNTTFSIIAFLIIGFIFSIFNQAILREFPKIPRLISFLQFITAVIYGYRISVKEKIFLRIAIIYLVFTAVFFLTNGAIENLLVYRIVDGAELMSSGRGARTLSGEPTFFALTMFNIYIIRRLLYPVTTLSNWNYNLFRILIIANIFLSFSGYGVAIVGIIIIVEFPYVLVIAVGLILFFLSDILIYLETSSNRAIGIIRLIISGKGLELLDFTRGYGYTFGLRFNSLLHNLERFTNSPILGGGFTTKNVGGGLVSFLAEVGIAFFSFLLIIVVKIFSGRFHFSFKIVLLFWIMIRFTSDSMGIPGVGIILGMLLASK